MTYIKSKSVDIGGTDIKITNSPLDGSDANIKDIISTAISNWMDEQGVFYDLSYGYYVKKNTDERCEIVLEFHHLYCTSLHLPFINADVNQMWLMVAECFSKELGVNNDSLDLKCQLYSKRITNYNPPVSVSTLKDMTVPNSKYFYLPFTNTMLKLSKDQVLFRGGIGLIEHECQQSPRNNYNGKSPRVMLRGIVNTNFEPIINLCSNCLKINLLEGNNFIVTCEDKKDEESQPSITAIPYCYEDGKLVEYPKLDNEKYVLLSSSTILVDAPRFKAVYNVVTHSYVSPLFSTILLKSKYPGFYLARRVIVCGQSKASIECYIDATGAIKSGVSYTHKPVIEPVPVSNEQFEQFSDQVLEELKVIERKRLNEEELNKKRLSLTLPPEVLESLNSDTQK